MSELPTFLEAKLRGAKQYAGKVCERHPANGGRRRTSNSKCTMCQGELTNERRKARRARARAERERQEAALWAEA